MGEMTQRFVEFVMMHAQNAALFLGQIPNPRTGEPEVNLDLAKMFIDQLVMVQEKTRGNLSTEETTVLRNALSNLQMAYVEVSGGKAPQGQSGPDLPSGLDPQSEPSSPAPEAISTAPEQPPIAPSEPDGESKKKFTKSYGP